MGGEEWKDVPGYPGVQASSDGAVRTERGGVLVQRFHKGYLHVQYKRHGRPTKQPVHKLVLLAFAGPKPSPLHECRHLDGNRRNNTAANLRWGTKQENVEDALRHGTHISLRRGAEHPRAKLSDVGINQAKTMRAAGCSYTEIARAIGCSSVHASRIVRNVGRVGQAA